MTLKPETPLEAAAGSVVTEAALTVLGSVIGGPLAPLLPPLAKSLAAGRQKARVEAAIREMEADLKRHEELLRDLTDSQYKLVNEVVLAVLHTTEAEKLLYLKRAVRHALQMSDLEPQEAIALSRIVRDISAEEATFLAKNFGYKGFHVVSGQGSIVSDPKVMRVGLGGREALIVGGLLSLGLLIPAEAKFDAPNVLRFSSIAAKVLVLLRDGDA